MLRMQIEWVSIVRQKEAAAGYANPKHRDIITINSSEIDLNRFFPQNNSDTLLAILGRLDNR